MAPFATLPTKILDSVLRHLLDKPLDHSDTVTTQDLYKTKHRLVTWRHQTQLQASIIHDALSRLLANYSKLEREAHSSSPIPKVSVIIEESFCLRLGFHLVEHALSTPWNEKPGRLGSNIQEASGLCITAAIWQRALLSLQVLNSSSQIQIPRRDS